MESNKPPSFALRFIRAICPDNLLEEIEGDLLQRYERDVRRFGVERARRRFVWTALRFFRPEILLRNSFSYRLINTIMFRNYITVAFRNLSRNKVFSAINILGLGIGLAACLLIFQFVSFELSYDHFNENFERIYRVTNDRFQNGKLIQHGTITYPTIGPAMAKDYPEIEAYTRLMPSGDLNVKVGEKTFDGDQCHFADEHFFKVLTFPFLAGDPLTALKQPYGVVLTEKLAEKYFGVDRSNLNDAIGKTFSWGLDQTPYVVTGVCENVPENSHIYFDALIAYTTLISQGDKGADDSWTWSDFRHYLLLKEGVDYRDLEKKFPDFSERYFKGDKVSGSVEKFYLQPLKEAHLYSDYEYDIARTASGKAVWAMLIVAVFILSIAWINYINLTTSRALDRAKEVGLRKVMGAVKMQLIKQFLFESILITAIAFIVAIILVQFAQTPFNEIFGDELSLLKVFRIADRSAIVLFIAVLVLMVIASGFYPAFVLSSYQPVKVLKGKFLRSSGGSFLRKSLVVFQFTASATLVTATLFVSRQVKFMNEADLGIDIKDILIVQGPELMQWDSTFIQRVENYKNELTTINGVESAATSSRLPGARLGRRFGMHLADQPASVHYTMSFFGVDHDFLSTYNVSTIAGRRFNLTDHNADFREIKTCIINLNAVKLLGIKSAEEAVGKVLASGDFRWTIAGVVNDFHQESLKKPKEPIVFLPTYSTYAPTSIRIKTSDQQKLIADVKSVYNEFFPANDFQYLFLEDRYKTQYDDDNRFSRVVTIFTILGILISCLGLIGLSSYTAVQRTKEIGIRKALGASLANIIGLLSTDFIKLVVIAILISIPIGYLAIDNWLQNYPYRIALEWVRFLLPAVIILVIALGTISFQVLKTARVNPADTLKYE